MYIHHIFPSERYRPSLSVTSLLLVSVFTYLTTGEQKKKLIKKKKEKKQTNKKNRRGTNILKETNKY